jgi:alkylation response protein AidB-like acyl-CoA dehydrogenase
MNFFADNQDLRHHIEHAIDWDAFVPQLEKGFVDPDGPKSVAEARELYQASLHEIGEYAAREIAKSAAAIDEQGVGFVEGRVVQPPALLANIDGLRRMGALAPCLPRAVGGLNFPLCVGAAATELIARGCSNTMLLYAFYQGPAFTVLRFGTPDQHERWVRGLAEGRISGAVAMTEPDAGSDLGKLATSAVPEGGHWRIHGRKQFITNGCGDMCIVLARTEPGSQGLEGLSLLIAPRIENGRENYQVAKPEKKFIIRGSATCELAFDGSCAELLGERGKGFAEILSFMNESRVGVAVQGLGISQAAVAAARAYAERRVQMDKPIARHELVADMLLDMETELQAMRALVLRCAELGDRVAAASGVERARLERELRDRTPLVKWFAAERTLFIARTAVQVHGGYGVVQDYNVERHYRDALILPIYEGTSQIQALMSLKDQVKWALERKARLLLGPVRVEAPPDTRGDALRELCAEYNRALRGALLRSLGPEGVLSALVGRAPARERFAYALLSAERLCAMLAYTRAAEALVASSAGVSARLRVADRFLHRALPLVRMHGELVRSGERSTLEALSS